MNEVIALVNLTIITEIQQKNPLSSKKWKEEECCSDNKIS